MISFRRPVAAIRNVLFIGRGSEIFFDTGTKFAMVNTKKLTIAWNKSCSNLNC